MYMGTMEEAGRKRWKRSELQSKILTTLAVGAVVVLAGGGLASALFQTFKTKKRYQPSSVHRSLKNLLSVEFVYFVDGPSGKRLEITEKGRRYLELFEYGEGAIAKPKKWDKRFRVVIFDIKETRKGDRNRLRDFLKKLGFMRLQNSVWVYPYDCENLIKLIKTEFKIGKDVLYMIVDSIEYDAPIRNFFDLPASS